MPALCTLPGLAGMKVWPGVLTTHSLPGTEPGCLTTASGVIHLPRRYWHTLPFLLLRGRVPQLLALASLAGIEVRLVWGWLWWLGVVAGIALG